MGTQQFCLKWNNHHSNMLSVFEQLLSNEALVDVTLACEGHSLKAHKVVLSACSPFFQTLFVDNPCKHPIVIMKDMRYVDMKAIIDFIYHGEVNVSQDQLSALLKTAETLKVKGLAEVGGEKQAERHNVHEVTQKPVNSTPIVSGNQHHRTESPPVHKRKRGRPRRRSGSSQSDTEDPVPSKIKEPDSPEIISDISRDGMNDSTPDVNHRLSSASQSRVPPIPPSQSYPQKSRTMYSPIPSQQESSANVEEPPSITDGDFDVEPSRLMEATLTTDGSGVSMYESQTQPSVSTSLALPSSSALEMPHSNSLSQAVVPTSLHSVSDSSGSGLGNQNTMEDIKPLVSFEEPPIGVSSHSQDSSSTNAVLPYMDTSGVSAIPGPSSFQHDMNLQPSPQQPSQGEYGENLVIRFVPPKIKAHRSISRRRFCPNCQQYYCKERLPLHKCKERLYCCPVCHKRLSNEHSLKRHIRLQHSVIPREAYKCKVCGKEFLTLSYAEEHKEKCRSFEVLDS